MNEPQQQAIDTSAAIGETTDKVNQAAEDYDDRLVIPKEEAQKAKPAKVKAAPPAAEKASKPEEKPTPEEKIEVSEDDEDRDFFLDALKEKEEAKKYHEEALRVANILQGIASKKDLKELVKLGVIDEDALIEASANILRAKVEQENLTEEQKAELAYKRSLEEKAKKAEELERRINEFEHKEAQIKFEAQLERDVPVALKTAGLPDSSEYHLALYELMERSFDLLDKPLTPTQAARVLKMKVDENDKRRWESLETLSDEDLFTRVPESVRERLRKAEITRARKGEGKHSSSPSSATFDPEDEKGLTWDEKIERRLAKLTSGE